MLVLKSSLLSVVNGTLRKQLNRFFELLLDEMGIASFFELKKLVLDAGVALSDRILDCRLFWLQILQQCVLVVLLGFLNQAL